LVAIIGAVQVVLAWADLPVEVKVLTHLVRMANPADHKVVDSSL
jgi:hypothetical protein